MNLVNSPLGAAGVALILAALLWIAVDWYNDR